MSYGRVKVNGCTDGLWFRDTITGPGRETVAFTPKHKVYDYLVEKSASDGIEYTALITGPFFDWGTISTFFWDKQKTDPRIGLVNHQFLGFDIPNKKVTLYNGGTDPFNSTTLESIGAAVVSILSTPEKFKNKPIRISDFFNSQKEVLNIIEAETGSTFEVTEVDIDKIQADTEAALRKGEWTQPNIFGAITASVFATKAASKWGTTDDTLSLGLPKKDLKTEIKKVLANPVVVTGSSSRV